MEKKLSLRSVACEVAKEFAREQGGFPSKYMKEAWAEAKERHPELVVVKGEKKEKPAPLPELEHEFFSVKYKDKKGHISRSIVPAKDFDDACRKFYDPEDKFGPKHEIIECTKPRKIPKDWTIAIKKGNGYQNVKLIKEVGTDKNRKVAAMLRGAVVEVLLSEITAANPPKKAAVMR